MAAASEMITINLTEVFAGSPLIYAALFVLSSAALALWLYTMATVRFSRLCPKNFLPAIGQKILDGHVEEAGVLCSKEGHFAARIAGAALKGRGQGLQVITDLMRAEARRSGSVLWQRLSILNDIAGIAPMLGLLGTVMGMFYAFYDMNRSVESISQVFDGLGVAVATTVAGLIVSIVAVALHSILRFRLTRLLTLVESEVLPLAHHIDHAAKPKKSSVKDKVGKGSGAEAPELAGLVS